MDQPVAVPVSPRLVAGVIRARARRLRQFRRLSFEAAKARSGLAKSVITRIEGGPECHRLKLRYLLALARAYQVPVTALIFGWDDELSAAPPARDSRRPVNDPDGQVHERVRARMRTSRGSRGTPTVSRAIGLRYNTELIRRESGEYADLDVLFLDRLAAELGTSLRAWLET